MKDKSLKARLKRKTEEAACWQPSLWACWTLRWSAPWRCRSAGSGCTSAGASQPPRAPTWTLAPPPSSGRAATRPPSSSCAALPSSSVPPRPTDSGSPQTPRGKVRKSNLASWHLSPLIIIIIMIQHLTSMSLFFASSNDWIISFACVFSASILAWKA